MIVQSKMWSTAVLAVAAGACFASAAAIIYLLTKEEKLCEDDKYGLVHSSKHSVVEVTVPVDIIGGIIGRYGANINRIQKQTKTKINFKPLVVGEDVRIAVIRGSSLEVSAAERMLKQDIADRLSITNCIIEIPTSACGAVIGKGGVNIRMINEASNAKVDIERSSRSATTKINIKGTEKEIDIAKGLIEEQVAENERFLRKKAFDSNATVLSTSTRQCELRGKQLCINYDVDKSSDVIGSDGFPKTEELAATTQDGLIEVFVSAVDSPSRFWVQLTGEMAIKLDKMDAQMEEFYKDLIATNEYLISDAKVEVGDLVAAKFGDDEGWYRAKVVHITPDEYDLNESAAIIQYVDYGEQQPMKILDLRRLAPDFQSIPFQAIECTLANVGPSEGAWSTEAIEEFKRLTYCAVWKVIMVKVEGRSTVGGVYSVTLVDTNDRIEVDIGKMLVDAQLAIRPSVNGVPLSEL